MATNYENVAPHSPCNCAVCSSICYSTTEEGVGLEEKSSVDSYAKPGVDQEAEAGNSCPRAGAGCRSALYQRTVSRPLLRHPRRWPDRNLEHAQQRGRGQPQFHTFDRTIDLQ